MNKLIKKQREFISKVRRETVLFERERIKEIIKKQISKESYLKKCRVISKERYEKEIYANFALNYILKELK